MFLYGAKWDEDEETLVDIPANAGQIGSELPMIHITIEPMDSAQEEEESSAIVLELTQSEHRAATYKETHYLCPVYVNFLKNRIINFQSSEGQMICQMPIPVRHRKPTFWLRRNVAILCYLDDDFDLIEHKIK